LAGTAVGRSLLAEFSTLTMPDGGSGASKPGRRSAIDP
jgi:hypothetical protein